ncbi:MAG TPA: hypothetical protein VNN10_12990 [Dehalococcoidia bacterium]|nr:hypothetical protein [Dehalococcoidia bacterium]
MGLWKAAALRFRDGWHLQRAADVFVAVLCLIVPTAYAVAQGQDTNWDQRNYHYYGAYAFLNGLSSFNILPSQIQTFLNPLLFVPSYLLISNLSPVLASAVLASLHGLNFLLVFSLSRTIFRSIPSLSTSALLSKYLLPIIATIIGGSAPIFVSGVGTTFGDNLTSVLVLLGLLLIATHLRSSSSFRVAGAGLAFGAATGLKLTNMTFLIGAVASFWWISRSIPDVLSRLTIFGFGALAGLLITHGYWSYYLTQEFESPLFPFYNAIFRSPFYDPINWRDARYIPDSLWEGLGYPFQWAEGKHPTSELPFRDLRFAIISILAPVSFLVLAVRGRRWIAIPSAVGSPGVVVLLFFLSSFVVWLFTFAVSRYVVALELLTGLVMVMLIVWIVQNRQVAVTLVIIAAAVTVLTTEPSDWGRASWSGDWYAVDVPAQLKRQDQMFIMLGDEPTSYVIPFLPKDARFIRIESNLYVRPETKLFQLQRDAIAQHEGPIMTLGVRVPSGIPSLQSLSRYGLRLSGGGTAVDAEQVLSRSLQGNEDLTWTLGPGDEYVVRLYDTSNGGRTLLAGVLVVAAGQGRSGTITASPNPCSGSRCTTTVTWTSQGVSSAQVTVEAGGMGESPFAGGASGSSEAPWILAGQEYIFRLHGTGIGDSSALLAGVLVTGVNKSSSGRVTASPNPCRPTEASQCSIKIEWTTEGAASAEVTVQAVRRTEPSATGCVRFRSKVNRFVSCPLERTESPP